MSIKILKQLSSENAQNRSSVPAFCDITNDSYLLAQSYSNPIGKASKPVAQAELSNVYDFSTGRPFTLENIDQLDYRLFDEKRLTLAPGQETTARFDM